MNSAIPLKTTTNNVLVPALALILPFLILPVELVWPIPYIVEEIAKAVVVWLIKFAPTELNWLKWGMTIGGLFALSETVLYLPNAIFFNNLPNWGLRLALTAVLHSTTAALMCFLAVRNRKLTTLGLILGMVIHFYYNYLVAGFIR